MKNNSLLIEADELANLIRRQSDQRSRDFLLIDLTDTDHYAKHHIPQSIFFDYNQLVSGSVPAVGLFPNKDQLQDAFSKTGLEKDSLIIAYDEQAGPKASRLLWTLDICGYKNLHLLNGGIHAWSKQGLGFEQTSNKPSPISLTPIDINHNKIADKDFILSILDNSDYVIWDTRTIEEYTGNKFKAARNGHIPGATHLNWLDTIDPNNDYRYKRDNELITLLDEAKITKDKTIIPYCQTFYRAAHSAILLKHLNYANVKSYPGSWSQWGNAIDTPID